MNDENTISKAKDKNITLRIVQDIDPQNPRTEWDNLGKMFCWHSRYDLGDKTAKVNSSDSHLLIKGIDFRRTEMGRTNQNPLRQRKRCWRYRPPRDQH